MKNHKQLCPLCRSVNHFEVIEGVDTRVYYLCNRCCLIFVDKKYLLNKNIEKQRYLSHNNSIKTKGYVEFLAQAIEPALKFINKGMLGLDYGCGPGPTLSEILKIKGYTCENYDPFFKEHNLDRQFGYIFSTEVFEHFYDPYKEIMKISSILKDDGILVIMTERWIDKEMFSDWYYAKDNTHICFYHLNTFKYICEVFGFDKLFDDGKRVVILKKKIFY